MLRAIPYTNLDDFLLFLLGSNRPQLKLHIKCTLNFREVEYDAGVETSRLTAVYYLNPNNPSFSAFKALSL